MKYRDLVVVLSTAVLLFSAAQSSADEIRTDTSPQTATKADASPKATTSETGFRHKHASMIKLVDINSATKEELKKLPGISDAEADKIIAGRPFGSKAWLVTNKIIPIETYQAVKGLIICKLTKKDIEKITAQSKQKGRK